MHTVVLSICPRSDVDVGRTHRLILGACGCSFSSATKHDDNDILLMGTG